jgi:mRNA interferase MazF
MTVKRGEIWMANLNPIRGSEQAGVRRVLIFQNDLVSNFRTTALTILLRTNLRRASLPTCVRISKGDGGLVSDSVALGHQLRVLDRTRLQRKLGTVSQSTLLTIEGVVLFTLGIVP